MINTFHVLEFKTSCGRYGITQGQLADISHVRSVTLLLLIRNIRVQSLQAVIHNTSHQLHYTKLFTMTQSSHISLSMVSSNHLFQTLY